MIAPNEWVWVIAALLVVIATQLWFNSRFKSHQHPVSDAAPANISQQDSDSAEESEKDTSEKKAAKTESPEVEPKEKKQAKNESGKENSKDTVFNFCHAAEPDAKGSMKVTVPEGARGGETLTIKLPTGESIEYNLPEGTKGGDVISVDLNPNQEESTVTINVPEGVQPGEVLCVQMPNGATVQCTIPEGVKAGDPIVVKYNPNTDVQASKTIKVPEGSKGGDTIEVQGPGGETLKFTLPGDAEVGQEITLQLRGGNLAKIKAEVDAKAKAKATPDKHAAGELLKHGKSAMRAKDWAAAGTLLNTIEYY